MRITPGEAPNILLGLQSLPIWIKREAVATYRRVPTGKGVSERPYEECKPISLPWMQKRHARLTA